MARGIVDQPLGDGACMVPQQLARLRVQRIRIVRARYEHHSGNHHRSHFHHACSARVKHPGRLQVVHVRRRYLGHAAESPPRIVAVVRDPVLPDLLLIQLGLLHIDLAYTARDRLNSLPCCRLHGILLRRVRLRRRHSIHIARRRSRSRTSCSRSYARRLQRPHIPHNCLNFFITELLLPRHSFARNTVAHNADQVIVRKRDYPRDGRNRLSLCAARAIQPMATRAGLFVLLRP